MRRRSGIAFIELLVLAWAGAATASAPTPIRIQFDGSAICSTPGEFFRAIQGRNERVRLAMDGERAFGVRVRLARAGSNVRGELSVIHEHGETSARAVEGASCDIVVEALSLTAALALDAVVAEGTQGAEAAPVAQTTPETNPVAPAPEAPAERSAEDLPAAPAALDFELGAQALGAELVSPHVNLGAGLVMRLTLNRDDALSPSLGISLFHARNDLLGGAEEASILATAALLTACPWRLDLGELIALRPCAAAGGGALNASGENIQAARSVGRSWWAAGGLLRGSAALGARVALELEGGFLVPLFERRFVIAPTGRSVGETPLASPFVSIGIIYGF